MTTNAWEHAFAPSLDKVQADRAEREAALAEAARWPTLPYQERQRRLRWELVNGRPYPEA